MDEVVLGRFGDRRLEKGGRSCTHDWLKSAAEGCVSGGWAGTELARYGSRDFCVTAL